MFGPSGHIRTASPISIRSASRNAVKSRLLAKMPPEIRSRIWDFVFADLVVRINHGGRYKYQRGKFRHPIDGYSNGHQ
jgi:hypothetical protein